MGWFSSKSGWEDEYDRRIASGEYKTDKMNNSLHPQKITTIITMIKTMDLNYF